MTLKEFTLLDLDAQCDGVFETAVLIDHRTDGIYDYLLYQLYSFYVERKYIIGTNQLVDINAFEADCKVLDLYIQQINSLL